MTDEKVIVTENRKIVQIAWSDNYGLIALRDDGTVWACQERFTADKSPAGWAWGKFPDLTTEGGDR